jgi:hypothetical protein
LRRRLAAIDIHLLHHQMMHVRSEPPIREHQTVLHRRAVSHRRGLSIGIIHSSHYWACGRIQVAELLVLVGVANVVEDKATPILALVGFHRFGEK